MRREKVCAWVLLTLFAFAGQVTAQFWYGSGGPMPLVVDSSRVTIKFDDGFSPNDQASILRQIERIIVVLSDPDAIDGFDVCSLSTGAGYDAFVDSIQQMDGIYLVEPYYRSPEGDPMLVGQGFCASFNEGITPIQIDSLNGVHGVTIDREIIGMPNTFVLENSDSSGYRLLELANIYHELPQTQYAHPDFRISIERTGYYKLYDYYNSYQPHLKKIIGQFNSGPTVWDFAGVDKSIVVAVVDDGVEPHEDLPSERVLAGIDVSYPHDYDPSPGSIWAHGMGCAGIIAASHTTDSGDMSDPNTGVISMDPNVLIMPVKIFQDEGEDSSLTDSDVADAIGYAWTHGADILSNSWGSKRPYDSGYTVVETAIRNAFIYGRGGLGCPIIFSAGNFGDYFPNIVGYPAKLDSCFAVGALTLDDTLWYYSCRGPDLDIAAPSGDVCGLGDMWTIDQMDLYGFNYLNKELCEGISITWDCPDTAYEEDPDYDCKFGGTSAACPLVSGTAAILLSRDSTLTAQQVYDILRYSAIDGPVPEKSNIPDTIPPSNWGRLDAFRAVLAIVRGDANNDGELTVGDASYIVQYIFQSGAPPEPHLGTGDADCDGLINIGDAVYIINYLFKGGDKPGLCYTYDY